mgnify:FL=1
MSIGTKILKSATKRVLKFDYRSVSSQEYKPRILNPYHVLCQKGNWYVFGFDQKAEENRIYALSRFKNPKITSEQFKIPEGFDISKEVDLSFGIWHNTGDPEEYELLFDASLANYIMEREWHKGQVMEQKEDGTVYLKFSSNQRPQVMSWVQGFGPAVTVLGPESLKNEIIENAKKVLSKYEK